MHPDYIKLPNSAVDRLNKDPNAFFYHKHDEYAFVIQTHVDALFGSKIDLSSEPGYTILLCDVTNLSFILAFFSRKHKKVTRFILSGEVYASTEFFNCVFMIHHDLESMYQRHSLFQMHTDRKQFL